MPAAACCRHLACLARIAGKGGLAFPEPALREGDLAGSALAFPGGPALRPSIRICIFFPPLYRILVSVRVRLNLTSWHKRKRFSLPRLNYFSNSTVKRHGSQLVLLWQSNFNVAFILLTSETLKRSGEIDFWRGLFEGISPLLQRHPRRLPEQRR